MYFPIDNQPIDATEEDFEGRTIEGEEFRLLDTEQDGDKILLIAASRWKKTYGSTTSVAPGVDTYFQSEQ